MLNTGTRREAVKKLEGAVKRHEAVRAAVQEASVELFEARRRAAGEVIEQVEVYVSALANSPKGFDKTVAEYRIEVDRFDEMVHQLEVEAARTLQIGSATGMAGAAAGAGVMAFGPTAAMAVATTFGTASTGTAISTLSGAAATNAALAWLGGGTLAAGGGGVVAGKAFLALAGPVGWTIGGVAFAGSALYLHQRNAKLAEEATQARVRVEGEVRSMKVAGREIRGLRDRTINHADGCLADLTWLRTNAANDYQQFDPSAKERLAALVNHVRSMSELLRATVQL